MIVVTGASGHIVGNLVNALGDSGRHVRAVIGNNHMGRRRSRHRVRAWRRPRPGLLEGGVLWAKVMYHLAGIISLDGDQGGLVPAVNVTGVRNVCERPWSAESNAWSMEP
jgi:dihydroflavonol-4-reductase